MKATEYRQMNEKELLEIKKELEFSIMGSHGKIEPIIKPEQRRKFRRERARIVTILKERGKESE